MDSNLALLKRVTGYGVGSAAVSGYIAYKYTFSEKE